MPLSLGFPDLTLRQNPKHHFLTSNWCKQGLSINTPKWSRLDNRYYVSHERYQSYIQRMLQENYKFILPSSSLKPLSVKYVNDVHQGISAKNCSRKERGQSETWVHLKSLEQKMLSNKEWLAFFHNIKNKQHLCGNDFVQSSTLPILVNNKNETFKISSSVTKVFDCNHKEVDTRMIFPVLQQKTNIAVC